MRLLSQEPVGIDSFGGESQRRLADQIVSEIISPSEFCDANGNVHEHSVVLALEGAWGTGKSNVLRMIEQGIVRERRNVVMIRYDVWEHRQELSRKSILEKLVRDLTSETYKLLPKRYCEKLFLLTGESVSNYVESTEKYHWIAGIAVCALILLSICKLELLKSPWYLLAIFLVSIVGSVLYDILCLKIGVGGAFCRLLMAFRMKAPEKLQRRFSHKEDATVEDFRAFLHSVSTELGKKRRKKKSSRLVIAFDNLDRVNDDEIRNFWGSIHVLFAEERSNRPSNIQVIIPYDRNRVRKAFGACDDGDETIRKTVDLVYNMPELILADWTTFLKEKLNDVIAALPKVTTEDIEQTVKIFNWLHTVDDLAPRAIISFVNSLAVQYSIADKNSTSDRDRIPLPYVALYVLGWSRRNSKILSRCDNASMLASNSQTAEQNSSKADVLKEKSPCFDVKVLMLDWHTRDQMLISGAFLKEKSEAAWRWYIGRPGESSIYMAAVVYQLPVSKAEEVLSYQRLGLALDTGDSDYVSMAYSKEGFHKVFSVIIRQARNFEGVTKALEGITGDDAQIFWDEFYDMRRDEIVELYGKMISLTVGESLLFRHISKWREFYTILYGKLLKGKAAIFNENLQVQFARDVEKELSRAGRTLVGSFSSAPVAPEEMLRFLNAAGSDYRLLNLSCDMHLLEEYLVPHVKNNNLIKCSCARHLDVDDLNKMPKFRAVISEKLNEIDLSNEMQEFVNVIMAKYHHER